jgi:hypothetical protein
MKPVDGSRLLKLDIELTLKIGFSNAQAFWNLRAPA